MSIILQYLSNPALSFDAHPPFGSCVIFRSNSYLSVSTMFRILTSFGQSYPSVNTTMVRRSSIFRSHLCFDNKYLSTITMFRVDKYRSIQSVTLTTVTISETLSMLTAVNQHYRSNNNHAVIIGSSSNHHAIIIILIPIVIPSLCVSRNRLTHSNTLSNPIRSND